MIMSSRHQHPRTLSIGGATYDLFLTIDPEHGTSEDIILHGGDKIPVRSVIEACGGGACNTAVGLQRLGCEAHFCGVIGSDQWGERLLEAMHREGVGTESVTIVEGETSSFSIIINLPNGERCILATSGANQHLHDTTFDLHAVSTMDALYINHLCETSCMIQNDLIEVLRQHPSIFVTWNPGGIQIHRGVDDVENHALVERSNLLLLNKEEALAFTKASSVDASLALLRSIGAEHVCITDGKHGVLGSSRSGTIRCSALPSATIVDTTGAGDAFGSATTAMLLQGLPLRDAMIAGTLNASSVLGTIGAEDGLLTFDELKTAITTHSPTLVITSC